MRRQRLYFQGFALLALAVGCDDSGTTPVPRDAGVAAQDLPTSADLPAVTDAPATPMDRPDVQARDIAVGADVLTQDIPVVARDIPEVAEDATPVPEDAPVTTEDIPTVNADVPAAQDVVSPRDVITEPPGVPIYAAGDIASCLSPFDEMTADLLDSRPGTILALGDLAYQSGAAWEFLLCYGPTWGRHRARTRPAVGNHEYETRGARDYYEYFGAAAGRPTEGFYSFDHAGWHLVSLNTNCSEIGGCGPDSPQGRWLRADLAAHPNRCTLAYMHHPRFSSGRHGSSTGPLPLWEMLYAADVDLVLVGHDHHYERFAPMRPDGTRDDARGIRQFLVGSGGIFHYALEATQPNSEVRNNDTHGVLELTLRPDRYDWRFIPVAGRTFTDSGSTRCH